MQHVDLETLDMFQLYSNAYTINKLHARAKINR